MFQSFYESAAKSAVAKNTFFKENPLGYMIAAMMAGFYITFGGYIFVISGAFCKLESAALNKLVPTILFAAALSIVMMAGSELFTGNNLIMSAGSFKKLVSWGDTIKLWIVCYIGNLIGTWISICIFHLSALDQVPEISANYAAIGAAKTSPTALQLTARGLLCNMLVCIAIWCGVKMVSESGKLIMVFWCIAVFMICGFEHSIANMGTLGVALLVPDGITIGQYCYNLLFVTIGNILGGAVFISLPYFLMAKPER